MGSRKHRRERDEGRSSRRRHSRSHSRSPAKDSKSKSRSRSPIAPPPPNLKEKDDRHDERRSHRSKREHRHRHHHRERSASPSKSSRHRSSRPQEVEIHSDSSDCVEVVPSAPPAPVLSKSTKAASPVPENGAGDTLSIDETNKLRAKLGLKPLEVDGVRNESASSKPKINAEGNELHKDEWGEFYHKPANNISEKLQAEKLREKFRQNKEKRALEQKLKATKTLGESSDEEDISKWVDKSRDKAKSKADASRRTKLLHEKDHHHRDEVDHARKSRRETKKAYTDNNLKGLRVAHDVSEFAEGKSIILTLKDQYVLDEEGEDTLINVNIVDNEKYRKNVVNKKLDPNHYGYNVYEEQVDEFGDPIQRDVLSKYDEEIGSSSKASFVLGSSVEQEIAQRKKLQEIKAKLSGKRLETLTDSLITPASDTYTEVEMEQFKKPKKRVKKLRQKLKAEDLEPLPGDVASSKDHRKRDPNRHLSDVLDTDDVILPTTSDMKMENEDNELEQILSKARRLKQVEAVKSLKLDASKIKTEIKAEPQEDVSEDLITLNETAEFCRTLGDIPTYGTSGNRGLAKNEIMDIESEPEDIQDEEQMEDEPITGQWSTVDPNSDTHQLPNPVLAEVINDVAILDEEPDVSSGMGAALKLALSKGYLEKEESNRPSNTRMAHLQAQNYSIEDKTHGEDDKHNRRDRFYNGSVSEFKDKANYNPNVKLEYIDDSGRLLNEKEAFRYLSHKFHGKGPGKNKIEKRLKKSEQETLMMKMSSTDTPLGTLTMLQHKQKETHSPFVVLSGSKQAQNTTITKYK